MKKLLIIAIIIAMVLSMGITAFAATGFTDITVHWAQNQITVMSEGGLVHGYPDGSFKPDNPISIAELCTLICQVKGYNPEKTHDYWAYEYIDYCLNVLECIPKKANGMATGYDKITSEVYNQPCLRGLAVHMVVNSVGSNNPDAVDRSIQLTDIPDHAFLGVFSDSILEGYRLGIVHGMDSKGTFNADGNFTRAEMCQIFYAANHRTAKDAPSDTAATLKLTDIWAKYQALGVWEGTEYIYANKQNANGDWVPTNTVTNTTYITSDPLIGGVSVNYYCEPGYEENAYISIIAMEHAKNTTTDQEGMLVDRYGNDINPDSINIGYTDKETGTYLKSSGYHYEARQFMKELLEIALPGAEIDTYELMKQVFLQEIYEATSMNYASAIRWIDGHAVHMMLDGRSNVFTIQIFLEGNEAKYYDEVNGVGSVSQYEYDGRLGANYFFDAYELDRW